MCTIMALAIKRRGVCVLAMQHDAFDRDSNPGHARYARTMPDRNERFRNRFLARRFPVDVAGTDAAHPNQRTVSVRRPGIAQG